jgi:AcrR family transcriptional regulator
MPRQVDHEARRAELAEASWRVARRLGVGGLTVRAVASEAGWTSGIVQHYFPRKDDLLLHAFELVQRRTVARIERIAEEEPPQRVLRATIVTLLPLDADVRAESEVWFSFLGLAAGDDKLRATAVRGHGELLALVTSNVEHAMAAGAVPSGLVATEVASDLLAFADGLNMQALFRSAGPGKSLDDIEPQVDGVVGSVVPPVSTNAKASAALTADACQGLDPCKVIAEVATPTDALTNGQVEEIKKSVPNAEVVQTIAGQFAPSVIATAAPDALAAHPDAQVWVSTADTQALAIVPALKQAGRLGKIKLVGNGGSRLGAKAVADGTLFGTVGGWPEQDGEIAAKMEMRAVNGQPIDPAGVDALKVDTPLVITKANVDQFTPEWGAERPSE